MVLRSLAEGFAHHGNVLGKVRLFDEAVWPHVFHQFVFCNYVFAALNQHQKDLKSFGSERHQLSVAQEQLSAGVKTVGAELV